jgi:PBSX family phage terminase large subunit
MTAAACAPPLEYGPSNRPYQPHGAAETLFYCRAEEVVLSGPAGTGKSRSCLEKLHLCALKYPGMRGLILRKTRESLTESALVTFEEKVLPLGDPIMEGAQRRMRQSYRYPNGSELVVGGLDKASKVMSTEYDMAYIQEAIEVTEDDWESVTTRLRNGVMPYQQLLADTNPDSATHWLKLRADAGKTLMLESRHEDNPSVTPEYLAKLDALTGVRFLRLRKGLWVSAEGAVYEDVWNPAIHRIDRFPIPKEWPRVWGVDFGYTNPFVLQIWALDPDGRMYRIWEIYRTQRLVEDHAADIRRFMTRSGERWPMALIADTDAEDRATLERHLGIQVQAAYKSVSPGIQAVAGRLRVAGDGKPRMFFLRDSVLERDADLVEKKRPTCTEEEVEGYIWNLTGGRVKGEEPVKLNDHGLDCARYVTAWIERLTDEPPKFPFGHLPGAHGRVSGWNPPGARSKR